MLLSNLRIENKYSYNHKLYSRVVCDISCQFCKEKNLFFFVEEEWSNWLTCDVYDAFLLAMIYPAMYYGESVDIQGCVTEKLYYNLIHYIIPIVKQYNPNLNTIDVKVDGYRSASKNSDLHIGTGFSGGVDSFLTLTDKFWGENNPEYKIDTLFFFHLGQYGNIHKPNIDLVLQKQYSITETFAKQIDVNSIFLNTNLFEFCKPAWEFSGGLLFRLAAIFVFQKGLRRYYLSNSDTYREVTQLKHQWERGDEDGLAYQRASLTAFGEAFITPLVNVDGLEIVLDGAQYTRTEKTKKISDNKYVQKYLSVCINSSGENFGEKNCGHCGKCLRTIIALEACGALGKFSDRFDLTYWNKHSWDYKCKLVNNYSDNQYDKDNVDFARKNGLKMPTIREAKKYNRTQFIINGIKSILYRVKVLLKK